MPLARPDFIELPVTDIAAGKAFMKQRSAGT